MLTMMMDEYQRWAMDVMKIRFNKKIKICKIDQEKNSKNINTKDIEKDDDDDKHVVDSDNNNNHIDVERGVFALENIDTNSSILEIPFSSLLSIHSISSNNTSSSLLHPLFDLQSILTREDDILSVLLIYEINIKKKDSKFYQHIQYIPKHYHNILYYNNDELEWIYGSDLYHITKTWQQQIHDDYDHMMITLKSSNNQYFRRINNTTMNDRADNGRDDVSDKADDDIYCYLTYDNYLWALCTIWSRFVTVDMISHSDDINRSLTTSPTTTIEKETTTTTTISSTIASTLKSSISIVSCPDSSYSTSSKNVNESTAAAFTTTTTTVDDNDNIEKKSVFTKSSQDYNINNTVDININSNKNKNNIIISSKHYQYRCMIPYFDMLNHNPSSKISHYYINNHVILYTTQKINENHEIFLNYGPDLSNTKLLMLYGFVILPSAVASSSSSSYSKRLIHNDNNNNNNNQTSCRLNDVDNPNKNDDKINPSIGHRKSISSYDLDDKSMNHNYINIWVSMSNDAYAYKAKYRLLQQLGINNSSEPFKISYIKIQSLHRGR